MTDFSHLISFSESYIIYHFEFYTCLLWFLILCPLQALYIWNGDAKTDQKSHKAFLTS